MMSENETKGFLNEMQKLEISYKELNRPIIRRLFNGFDSLHSYSEHLVNIYANVNKEIFSNLLLIQDYENKESYLKNLWIRCLHDYKEQISLLQITDDENLESDDGRTLLDFNVRSLVPNYEFKLDSNSMSEDELSECAVLKSNKLEQFVDFVFNLCKSQNIPIETEYLSIIDNDDYLIKSKQKKVIWNGTPGEFGAIFNLLIDKGFIELIKDKVNTVNLLSSVFDIKSDSGENVTPRHLYRCFGEKQRNYNPNQLKIPFSDNYNKD
jgi:hypothetical protein